MATIVKITPGFFTQTFENGVCVSQDFISSDEVSFEDDAGNELSEYDISDGLEDAPCLAASLNSY